MSRDTLTWLDVHLKGDASRRRSSPVRLYIMGSKQWRDFDDWPPPVTAERWHLQPSGGFGPSVPPPSDPDRYRYDPADPTPSVGGNVLGAQQHMGARDNRALESRADVLVYTSPILAREVEIIGPVVADLYVKSSLEYTDFFARLCVVEKSGRSINLCDGILRLTPSGSGEVGVDGIHRIQIELWPTAYHFQKGERLRLQVSSGAHPRFARNLGSGEPVATGTSMRVADQAVYHDPEHPSSILLPIHAP